jgi:hypothetical protein
MLSAAVPKLHSRRSVRGLLAVLVLAIGAASVVFAQPIQERILGRRMAVPAIAERIQVVKIEDEVGSFSGLPASSATRIQGVVINELGDVVPSAGQVIVRRIADGQVVAETPVDAVGQFSIRGIDSGLYSAELVNSAGAVLTSSSAFTVGLGEIVQLTPVISQHSIGGLAQFLTSGTTSAISSAVTAGVLTVAPPPSTSPEGGGR